MGLLDGILKGAAGAGLLMAASKVINDNGGIQGLVEKFQKGGLGQMVNSWVSTGQNQSATPEQVHHTLGPEQIQKLAQELGIPPQQLASQLAELLPQVVDKLTPTGEVPQAAQPVTAEAVKAALGQSGQS